MRQIRFKKALREFIAQIFTDSNILRLPDLTSTDLVLISNYSFILFRHGVYSGRILKFKKA
jgi:hypothetical protein